MTPSLDEPQSASFLQHFFLASQDSFEQTLVSAIAETVITLSHFFSQTLESPQALEVDADWSQSPCFLQQFFLSSQADFAQTVASAVAETVFTASHFFSQQPDSEQTLAAASVTASPAGQLSHSQGSQGQSPQSPPVQVLSAFVEVVLVSVLLAVAMVHARPTTVTRAMLVMR